MNTLKVAGRKRKMKKEKMLQITMPDSSVWVVPIRVIAENRAFTVFITVVTIAWWALVGDVVINDLT